jgi:ribosome-associated translation inhibitor RaiA
MKIHVRGERPAIDEQLRVHIERRIEFVLGRFATRILRATVQLLDVNSRLLGEEKACSIQVSLQPAGTVFVEGRGADFPAAIDRATERVGRSVARALEHEREFGGRIRLRMGSPGTPPRPEREDGPVA